jgi:hypothetical protein
MMAEGSIVFCHSMVIAIHSGCRLIGKGGIIRLKTGRGARAKTGG